MIDKLRLDVQHKLIKPSGEDFELMVQTELDLSAGIIGIFGGSGQGKSTLLQICAGLTPSIGSVVSWDNDASLKPSKEKAELSPCVYQSQEVTLFEHLTVAQNLEFVIKHSNWSANNSKFSQLDVVDWCGIGGLLNQSSYSLSGGEKQRVGLARSLLSGKPVIILDEPFSALDWQSRLMMLQLIQRLNQEYGLAFILVSHSLRELAICCQYLINLEQGKMVQSGAINEVVQALSLASSEPVFARLTLEKPEVMAQYHLVRWQLPNSEQYIFIKNQTDHSSMHTVPKSHIVTVEADKVSLSLTPASSSSMLNQLTGKITKIQPFQHLMLVHIDVQGQEILSLVSQLSYENLKLETGQNIFAQFKAV